MSEHSRYEKIDQQFNDLPMPDEEASWQKMKEMLDDDDDTIVPPPIFLKSCLGWGILLTGLIAAWLIIRPEKWWAADLKTDQISSSSKNQKQPEENPATPITRQQQNSNRESSPGSNLPTSKNSSANSKTNESVSPSLIQSSLQTKSKNPANKNFANNPKQIKERRKTKQLTSNQKPFGKKEDFIKKESPEILSKQTQRTDSVIPPSDNPTNNQIIEQENNPKTTDTLSTTTYEQVPVNADSLKSKIDSSSKKKVKQKKLLVAMGLGEQFLIPIAGQTTVPYSRYGRKSSLADYVPSFFVLLQKERKWFVQTEFRYGAAQSVKEFSYNQKTNYDALSNNVTTTIMRLKKTYYHQLPASFNYFINPNLSVGVGGMYSHFYGAVTEKEITTLNTQTQIASTFKEIIPVKHFTDSFLYKTQVHALLQADYHWKKFSFRLRYTKDIQPYIRYTRPDGTVDEEKNQSLQVIVRYRFWQSRKF